MATGKTVTEPALSRVTSVTRSAGRSSARTRRAPAWTRSWTGQRRRRSWASTQSRAVRGRVWGRGSYAATHADTAASSAGARTPASVSQSGKYQKRFVDVYILVKRSVKVLFLRLVSCWGGHVGVSASRMPAGARAGVGVASVWRRVSVSVSWREMTRVRGWGGPAMRSA